eukprot:scaffold626_cov409-Prasinococcus_capsulatus_cf.AAC.11
MPEQTLQYDRLFAALGEDEPLAPAATGADAAKDCPALLEEGQRRGTPETENTLRVSPDETGFYDLDFIALADNEGGAEVGVEGGDKKDVQARQYVGVDGDGTVLINDTGPPPWWRNKRKSDLPQSPLLRLHMEMLRFEEFLKPTQEEHQVRLEAIERVATVVKSIFPQANFEVFGSFAIDLYLPTSDIDCVVLNSGCSDVVQGLRAVATSLSRRGMVKNVQVIAKARVPIAKFKDIESGICFDVSFDKENGPQAASFIKRVMKEFVPMRSLVLVLKLFLQQRELNEVYTGGIGSYALISLILVQLQTYGRRYPAAREIAPGSSQELRRTGTLRLDVAHNEAEPKKSVKKKKGKKQKTRTSSSSIVEGCLGQLLLDFLRFYGTELNQKEVGVSPRDGGTFYRKDEEGMFAHNRPFLLSCKDPQDATNDLCRNSYNWPQIRSAFSYAHQLLLATAAEHATDGQSILECLVRRDTVLMHRKQEPQNGVKTKDQAVGMHDSGRTEVLGHRIGGNPTGGIGSKGARRDDPTHGSRSKKRKHSHTLPQSSKAR